MEGLHAFFSSTLWQTLQGAGLRGLPKQLHFVDDKPALFNIPALEIDVDVDGLTIMTISLSTLTI